MALPIFSQIVQSMLSFLQASRPDINTNTGTVTNDVVVSTVANQLSAENGTSPSVYSSIAYTQDLQAFVNNASVLVPADLDAIGANYGLTRLPGTAATGIITFRIRNYTTSSPIVTVIAGTVVSTLATSQSPAVSFSTTTTVTFFPSLAPSYFNPVSGFYEQSTTIVCQTIGTVGNVGAATITSLVGPGIGIDAVTNSVATTGGTNLESNTAYATRIQIKLSGNNVGTPNGIKSLVDTNPNVIDSIVVTSNDPEMVRSQFGGEVDVYIQGQVLLTTSDINLFTSTGPTKFILSNQPVDSASDIASIMGIVSGSPYTFIPTVDYIFVPDPNILYAGSSLAQNAIQFTGTVLPDNNTQFTITYAYDSLIQSLQSLFNNDSDHIVSSDILVREASEALIDVTENILIVPGYTASTVISNVQTALTNYINGLGLGAVIPLSEIVDVTQNVAGVAQVDLSTVVISSTVNAVITTVPPGQVLNITKVSYPQANVLTILIGA